MKSWSLSAAILTFLSICTSTHAIPMSSAFVNKRSTPTANIGLIDGSGNDVGPDIPIDGQYLRIDYTGHPITTTSRVITDTEGVKCTFLGNESSNVVAILYGPDSVSSVTSTQASVGPPQIIISGMCEYI
ncbi:hypothetical protein B7494_g1826 [Chlorociboria aeruginascens]|nr:hypothetical protein B7494_g1826 [Chlorociboria aeruginascens]